MDRQRWLPAAQMALTSQLESQRDEDRLALIEMVDRHGLPDVERWLKAIAASKEPPASDPRRI